MSAVTHPPTILRDIPIHLAPEQVVQELHPGQRGVARPGLIAAAREAVAMSESLIAPAAVFAEYAVRSVDGGRVILTTDEALAQFDVGPKADLLIPAQRVMVAVETIGPALGERVNELGAARETLLAFMLDSVGVLALGAVGEALRVRVEERASEQGWGVSPALSPGSLVGWPLQGQRDVCALLPLDEIGVRLSPHCVLEPHKSVSMVIGMGPEYTSAHVGSVCRYCSLQKTCWRRRGEAA